tara:strand:+ start:61 stop:435 length:375 start_codon:yes stop_codon:yes gene_type:complete
MEKEMRLLISKEVEEEMSGRDIEKEYIYMNETIKNSPGLRLNELGEKLKLKKETIKHMIECVKTYPCTFHNYGPYINKDGRYYIQGKDNTIKSLEVENKELKEKLAELKEILESREQFIEDHCA